MVFCNNNHYTIIRDGVKGHNPYFNRWFSAIGYIKNSFSYTSVTILILIDGFLQYNENIIVNRWFQRHNPYFNRWFSAITEFLNKYVPLIGSQSLF